MYVYLTTKNYSSETDKHKKMESANLNSSKTQDVLEKRKKAKKIKKKVYIMCGENIQRKLKGKLCFCCRKEK